MEAGVPATIVTVVGSAAETAAGLELVPDEGHRLTASATATTTAIAAATVRRRVGGWTGPPGIDQSGAPGGRGGPSTGDGAGGGRVRSSSTGRPPAGRDEQSDESRREYTGGRPRGPEGSK
jgi:hypothetical protein